MYYETEKLTFVTIPHLYIDLKLAVTVTVIALAVVIVAASTWAMNLNPDMSNGIFEIL